MSLRDKTISGLVWSTVGKWGGKVVTIAVFAILAHLLKPEAFGLIALATVFIRFIHVIVDQGFGSAIIQRDRLEKEHLHTAFWTNILLGIILSIAGMFAADFISNLMGEPKLAKVIKWLSLLIVIRSFSSVQAAIFRRKMKFKILSICSLIAITTGGAVGLYMAYSGFGVWSLVGQQITSMSVKTFALWIASDWYPKFSISINHFNDLFQFGKNVIGSKLLNFVNRRSDDFIIGLYLGPAALGYYSVAYKILQAVTQLVASVGQQVAFPIFSKLQGNKAKMRNAYYKVTEFASLIAFPIFGGLAALAPVIIPLIFGPQWQKSIPVMQVLAMIGILHTVFYFNSSVILGSGKSFWRFIITLINAVSNLLAFLIAVHWGIMAVAIAYVLRGYLLSPLPLYIVKKL